MFRMKSFPTLDEEEIHCRAKGKEHDRDAAGQADERERSGTAIGPLPRNNVRGDGYEQFEDAAGPQVTL